MSREQYQARYRTHKELRARYRTHKELRVHGAIGSLNEGIEISIHRIARRLIAWPGNVYQTEAVHVLTLRPGDESAMYRYGVAEEALLCMQGSGPAGGVSLGISNRFVIRRRQREGV